MSALLHQHCFLSLLHAISPGVSVALMSILIASDSILITMGSTDPSPKKISIIDKHIEGSNFLKSISIATILGSLSSLLLKQISDDWATTILGISFILFITQFVALRNLSQSLHLPFRKLSLESSK